MLKKVNDYPALKILGDPRRLAILQLLMEKPATLSHLGKSLGVTAANVRHHLVQLEEAGYVEMMKTRPVRGFTEKYYQATAQAYWINLTLMPEPNKQGRILMFGSHDPALELLSEQMKLDSVKPDLVTMPVGSLDGLIALQQGFSQISGCHLIDPDGGEYNISYVRHFFPGQQMQVVTLAHREQGLVVAPGNPKGITALSDLGRGDVIFINRKKGSGTRLWLDQQLKEIHLNSSRIIGYETEVNTHAQITDAVQQGRADVGLAVLAAARSVDLDFIPLFEERFDLVVSQEQSSNPVLHPLFDALNSQEIRAGFSRLGGYRTSQTGSTIQC